MMRDIRQVVIQDMNTRKKNWVVLRYQGCMGPQQAGMKMIHETPW